MAMIPQEILDKLFRKGVQSIAAALASEPRLHDVTEQIGWQLKEIRDSLLWIKAALSTSPEVVIALWRSDGGEPRMLTGRVVKNELMKAAEFEGHRIPVGTWVVVLGGAQIRAIVIGTQFQRVNSPVAITERDVQIQERMRVELTS